MSIQVTPKPTVTTSVSDGVGTVVLSRPSRHNALTRRSFSELVEAFRALADDSSCRVVVLYGEGPSFCSGLDLNEGMGESLEEVLATMRTATDVIVQMRQMPQPIVAAASGLAIGAGISLLAASDIRVVAPDVSMRAVFTAIGMSAGDLGLSWTLPRLLGASAASELFYTASSLNADDALRLGMANHVCAEPVEEAMRIAAVIASRAPIAVRMSKDLLNASLFGPGYREHLELEMRTQLVCAFTADHREAVLAFKEKRQPSFGH